MIVKYLALSDTSLEKSAKICSQLIQKYRETSKLWNDLAISLESIKKCQEMFPVTSLGGDVFGHV